jgi:hypothetical protein
LATFQFKTSFFFANKLNSLNIKETKSLAFRSWLPQRTRRRRELGDTAARRPSLPCPLTHNEEDEEDVQPVPQRTEEEPNRRRMSGLVERMNIDGVEDELAVARRRKS